MTGIVDIDQLISSGIHFGHRVRFWNPKMEPYIFNRRNGIHIIDTKETIKGLIRAQRFIEHIVSQGRQVLFVGTKRQAASSVMETAASLQMPYASERWLGGTLTNNKTVRQRLSRLEELEKLLANESTSGFSKKALASLMREHRKIHRNLNGIRNMNGMPGALVIIDINREYNAVAEARRMKIPTVALVDTDSDPALVDIVVPGNDDALKSINLFLHVVSEGVKRGRSQQQTVSESEAKPEASDKEDKTQVSDNSEASTASTPPSVVAGQEEV